jgi:hypothetical protein
LKKLAYPVFRHWASSERNLELNLYPNLAKIANFNQSSSIKWIH